MTDDRWNLKGSDPTVIERFRATKADYDEQLDEPVTNDRALELLMDGVPVERSPQLDELHEQLDTIAAMADGEDDTDCLTTEEFEEGINGLYEDLNGDHERIKDSMPSTSRGSY